MKIRLCTEADIDAVNAIYNYEIENVLLHLILSSDQKIMQ